MPYDNKIVVGHGNFFYKGHKKAICFILSGFRPSCPYSMVILCRIFQQIQYLCKGKDNPKDKNKTPHLSMQGLIFLCRSQFSLPFYRINFRALRQKMVFAYLCDIAACAAASRAIGTLNGEQET